MIWALRSPSRMRRAMTIFSFSRPISCSMRVRTFSSRVSANLTRRTRSPTGRIRSPRILLQAISVDQKNLGGDDHQRWFPHRRRGQEGSCSGRMGEAYGANPLIALSFSRVAIRSLQPTTTVGAGPDCPYGPSHSPGGAISRYSTPPKKGGFFLTAALGLYFLLK